MLDCGRMCSDAFGCVRVLSDAWWPKQRQQNETNMLENHMHFYNVFKELCKDRSPHPTARIGTKQKKSASKMTFQVVTILNFPLTHSFSYPVLFRTQNGDAGSWGHRGGLRSPGALLLFAAICSGCAVLCAVLCGAERLNGGS